MMVRKCRLLVIIAASLWSKTQGYVTSYSALPMKRQHQWLEQLSSDICETKIGQLTANELTQGHEIMKAWSHSKTVKKEHALVLETLIVRMVKERMAGNEDARVTLQDYNSLLHAWAKSGAGDAAAERCQQILEGMKKSEIQPDLSSYKAVLMAWHRCKSNKSAANAQALLEDMVQQYQSGANPAILPDADCFDTVLQCHGRSTHRNAPQDAEQLLCAMERLLKSTGTWKPRTTSFNAVLAAWSNSKNPVAASRAGSILSFMELLSEHKDSDVTPDSFSYTTVLGLLAKHGNQKEAAESAQYVLSRAIYRYQEQKKAGQQKFRLYAILFSTACGCLSKSNMSGSFVQAAAILSTQESIYNQDNHVPARPDVYSYTSVIDCCAREPNKQLKKEAFRIARQTYEKLQEQGTPNHVSYGIMLKAIVALIPNKQLRTRWTRRVFEDACRDGYVGDMVLNRARQAVSSPIFKELTNGSCRNSLPTAWTRNVPNPKKFARQRAEV